MSDGKWHTIIELLRGVEHRYGSINTEPSVHRIEFAPGLTDAEVTSVQDRFKFRFPPDLRDFLQTALPSGPKFPNWRSGDPTLLGEWLDIPRDGVLFDVEYNAFWLDEWGPKPESMPDTLALVSDLLQAAPQLIPIFAHRMMPDEPHLPGNPVFSVHQTDIIHYGYNLANYLCAEFKVQDHQPLPTEMRSIRFWDLDRFQEVRWRDDGVFFDNRRGLLP